MSFLKQLLVVALILAGTVTAFLMTPQSWPILASAMPVGELDLLEFDVLKRPDSPNHYLVCPRGYCVYGADTEAPEYDIPVEALRARFFEAVELNLFMHIENSYDQHDQYDIVERSRLMAFPDVLTVRFFSRGENASTLAIYSRSLYGYWDFGVNRARVEKLLSISRP